MNIFIGRKDNETSKKTITPIKYYNKFQKKIKQEKNEYTG